MVVVTEARDEDELDWVSCLEDRMPELCCDSTSFILRTSARAREK